MPVIIDAGIGTASDASIAMEMGADAVLLNTAIAKSENPTQMALAMKLAVESGRLATNQEEFLNPNLVLALQKRHH